MLIFLFLFLMGIGACIAVELRIRLRKRRPRRQKKRRPHGVGWVAPKSMMAGIQAQLAPAVLALGWEPMERRPARKGESRFGEFEFKRVEADRIESLGIDFQYGDKPAVYLCLALWTGEAGVCTLFQAGGCYDCSERKRPLLRRLREDMRRKPAEDALANALSKGLERIHLAEAYFRQPFSHPDIGLVATRPPYRWPEGYDDRIRRLSANKH